MAFKGKVALVTGGGSGMGQQAAWALANTGAEVVIADVNEKGMEETARNRPNIHPMVCDVTDYDRVKEVIDETEGKFGPIDRLTHAAGIMPDGVLLDEDIKKHKLVFDINYWGTVYFAKILLKRMVERGSGDFVSFGSMAGYYPIPKMSSYCASKAAVDSFMEIAHWENKDSGVRITVVCPGKVDTPLLKQSPDMKTFKGKGKEVAVSPAEIIGGIEKSLEKGEFICLPDKNAKIAYKLRRFFPKMAWKMIMKEEGLM